MCIICCISRDATVARDEVGDAASAAAALPERGARAPTPALMAALRAVYSASSSRRCLLGAPGGRCCRDGVWHSGGTGGGRTLFLGPRQGLQVAGRGQSPTHRGLG